MAKKRLQKELSDLIETDPKLFRNIIFDEKNIFNWQVLVVPENPPYNKGAFKIDINFPAEYPFKPPKILFKTKIYHPNIDEMGHVKLPIKIAENWQPTTKTYQVIQSLIELINDPQPEPVLRADLYNEFIKDKQKFMENAEEFTKKYAEKRPQD